MGNTASTNQPANTEPEVETAHEGHEGDGCDGCQDVVECKPEPYNHNLAATVGYFTRSVIVCTGEQDWPTKVEKTKGTFVHSIAAAIKSRDDIQGLPKVTACSEASSSREGHDVYVYPDAVKYIGVKEEDIPAFVEDQIVKGEISTRLKHISVSGRYHVLVCTHATRDRRCGRSGVQALDALKQLMTDKGIPTDKVMVDGSSHVGGHKYAGVVVVYPPGDFYGYIGAKNVEAVVDSYLDPKKPRANQFWRGRMGIDEEQQAKEAGMSGPKKKKEKREKVRP